MFKTGANTSIKSEENSIQRIFDGKDHTNSRKRLLNIYYDPPKPDTPPVSFLSFALSFFVFIKSL